MESLDWVILTAGIAICLALLVFSALASFFIPAPPDGVPRRREMRRCMFMGFYCNARDPRIIVPRPHRGWTVNLRDESLAMLFCIMLAVILGATLIIAFNALP